jgi:ABC-2 type transport system ATP-binding protein
VIEVRNLTKRFGKTVAVDDLSFDVQPGRVTGFLGPNGSGKSTTMRCMVGLDRHERGGTMFHGKQYRSMSAPLHEVGILLDAGYVHPARSGRNHLKWLAASNGISRKRVDEVLELVGMSDAADRKLKAYSLGMKQRLGLAATLLGDPETIILDEPANGLDPEGVRWIRDFLRHYANEGRSVLVSSHLLAEMSLLAQDLVVIGKGRLISQSSVGDFVGRHSATWVTVRSPQLPDLIATLAQRGAQVTRAGQGASANVFGLTIEEVGEAAASANLTLHELSTQTESLEDAFLTATADAQEYRSGEQHAGGAS